MSTARMPFRPQVARRAPRRARPPNGNQQLECYCTTSTCGAGMLDVRACGPGRAGTEHDPGPRLRHTLRARTGDYRHALDGSTSVPANGQTVTGYQWTMVNSGGIATLGATTNAPTVTVATSGGGSFTVRLAVTDSGADVPHRDEGHRRFGRCTNREPACGFRRRRHDVMALACSPLCVAVVGAAPATPIKSASRRRARNNEPRTGVTVLVYRPFGGYR